MAYDDSVFRQRGKISRNGSPATSNHELELLEEKQHNKLETIKDRAQILRTELLENIDEKLDNLLDCIGETQSSLSKTISKEIKRPKSKSDPLTEKKFKARRSVLTELLELQHVQTIYNIFIAILIIFGLNTFVYELVDTGRITVRFDLIHWAFGKLPVVMWLWCIMLLCTMMIVFPLFHYWAHHGHHSTLSNCFWLAIYASYLVAFVIFPMVIIVCEDLPPASTFAITIEQIRLTMKTHSFVRENIPRSLAYHSKKSTSMVAKEKEEKGDEDDEESDSEDSRKAENSGFDKGPCPGFSNYLYFLFAPTLIYRDHYPQTPHIRWNYVVSNLLQVLACCFYTYYIFIRFCLPVFQNFGKEHLSLRSMVLIVFGSVMPASLVLFLGFFAILHSWLNAFAEMLRFADRQFYQDWWNATSFAYYYRTWNIVVHDWLYSYVYKEYMAMKSYDRSQRAVAMMVVFLLSALAHEYVLIMSLRLFYPVLFTLFAGIGFGLMFVQPPSGTHPRGWNVFLWVALFLGSGLLMSLYSQEWYARINCPQFVSDSYVDLMLPRSWFCNY